jgi:hypothetical protein
MSEFFQEGDVAPGGISIENILNRSDGSLPFGLYCPATEGKLTWICNISQENNIIGVYNMDLGEKSERNVVQYLDIKEAEYSRDELLKAGWQLLVPPKIQFTVGDQPLNRREKRKLQKQINEIKKDMHM